MRFITEEEKAAINNAYPPEKAKQLTSCYPVSDPLMIMTSDEQSQKDREADDEKYQFIVVNPDDTTQIK